MVGRAYQHGPLALSTGWEVVEVRGLEACGLGYSIEGRMVTGVPDKDGDFELVVHCKGEGDEVQDFCTVLIINPDPRSLWKSQEPPADSLYPKDHGACSYYDLGERKLVVASQRGRSHGMEGKFREDDVEVWHDGASGWSVIAVADGAGSAAYSREGSKLACAKVCSYFADLGGEGLEALARSVVEWERGMAEGPAAVRKHLYAHFTKAAWGAMQAIALEATGKGLPAKAYATTLVFALMRPFGEGYFVASFGVGDSPMGVWVEGEEPISMHAPEEGEFASQTWFLTMPEVFKSGEGLMGRIQFRVLPRFKAMVLMTDGVYDPKFETRGNLMQEAYWKALWTDLEGGVDLLGEGEMVAEQLLRWLDFWSQGNHDDRTIALVY